MTNRESLTPLEIAASLGDVRGVPGSSPTADSTVNVMPVKLSCRVFLGKDGNISYIRNIFLLSSSSRQQHAAGDDFSQFV